MADSAVLFLLLASGPTAGPVPLSAPLTVALLLQQQPDTSKARAQGRWPNDQDVAKLQSAQGQPIWVVLLILGHPSSVNRQMNGIEGWNYPWLGTCQVEFRNGVCEWSTYLGGY